jgi:carbohydrate-selective porin OprB
MLRAVLVLFVALLASPTSAQEDPASSEATAQEAQRQGFSTRRSRLGYTETNPVFAGPTSPQGEIEETDRELDPAFRFPGIDAAFQPWHDWQRKANNEHGVQLSAHYSTLYQGLSDSLTGEDQASAGVLRATLKWKLSGRETGNEGALNVMVDHRHGFRDITPADLAAEAGYIGLTGLFYNDIGLALINLNWTQALNDGRAGLVVGRYDPNDYQNVLGMVNPWTLFSNLATNLDTTVALPDSSWGIGGGAWLTDSWYVLGGVNDANGLATDDLDFFAGGAEFYKYFHVGWSPSKGERYFRNVHVLAWHVDDREDAGIESAHGISLAANWTFDDRWMPYARLGFSKGSAPIYNESVTVGLIRKFLYRSDVIGLSVNHGSTPDDSLRDQTTIEAFWRYQFSQGLAITPSVQLLLDPALNPGEDTVWVLGLRFRLNL